MNSVLDIEKLSVPAWLEALRLVARYRILNLKVIMSRRLDMVLNNLLDIVLDDASQTSSLFTGFRRWRPDRSV